MAYTTREISEQFGAAAKLSSALCPNLMTFFAMCNKSVRKDVTMRLNCKIGMTPIIEYNPEFVGILSTPTLSYLLTIELLRLVLHHCTIRLMTPLERCYKASTIVCGPSELRHERRIDPEVFKHMPTLEKLKTEYPKLDMKEDNCLERIFAILGALEHDKKSSAPDKNEGNEHKNDDGSYKSEADAISDHFSETNQKKNTEGWGENPMVDGRVIDAVKKTTDSKAWGSLPGDYIMEIIKANNRYDPRGVIKHFARSVFCNEIKFTRMKPSRRFGGKYIGVIQGKRHTTRAKVLIATDTSGSMNPEEWKNACGFIASVLKHAEVDYAWWDTECTLPETIGKPKPMTPKGGGGTNPDCVMKMIKKNNLSYDGIIFITDCGFSWSQPTDKTKIFILQTDDAAVAPAWCKYVVKMSDLRKFI